VAIPQCVHQSVVIGIQDVINRQIGPGKIAAQVLKNRDGARGIGDRADAQDLRRGRFFDSSLVAR
jgi:hypothetical protein